MIRAALIASLTVMGAAQAQEAAKPSWLSSKPAAKETTATWPTPAQYRACLAALKADDPVHAIPLANYRALYFQHATKVEGLTLEAAGERLKTPVKPAMTAGACLKLAPAAFDRKFKAAHPWATSYFDSGFDREMFEPVPGALAVIAP